MAESIVMMGRSYLNQSAERMEKRHPIMGMVLFQMGVGLGLIGAVAGIAAMGGAVIWMFYRAVGVM